MNHAGEISTLVRVAEPDVRVWTNVGEAHLEFFGSLDDTADAKAEILEGASGSTLLVANADDERIMARTAAFAGRLVTFGIERPADVRASAIVDRGVEGTTARITTPRGTFDMTTPLVGRGQPGERPGRDRGGRRARRSARGDRRTRAHGSGRPPAAARSSGCRAGSRSSTTATTPIRPRPARRWTCSRARARPPGGWR